MKLGFPEKITCLFPENNTQGECRCSVGSSSCGITGAMYLYLSSASQSSLMLQYLLRVNWITEVLVKKYLKENVYCVQWGVFSDSGAP